MGLWNDIKNFNKMRSDVKKAKAVIDLIDQTVKTNPETLTAFQEYMKNPLDENAKVNFQRHHAIDGLHISGKIINTIGTFSGPGYSYFAEHANKRLVELEKAAKYIYCTNSTQQDIANGIVNGSIDQTNKTIYRNHECQKELNDLKKGGQHNKLDSVIPTPDNGIQSQPGQANINRQDGEKMSRADILKEYMANTGNPILDKVMAQKIDRDLAQQEQKIQNPTMQQTMQPSQPSL